MRIPNTYRVIIILFAGVWSLVTACKKYDANYSTADTEWLNGGGQTIYDEGSAAFGHMFNNLPQYLQRVHEIGDLQFGQTFVSAPAPVNPGLGPIFNNVSCGSCHIADGRGKVPGAGEPISSILFRLSLPGVAAHGSPLPVPGFGDQLQTRAILGTRSEADVTISYIEQTHYFADGIPYSLRTPTYTISNPYMPFPAGTLLSPRVAAPVFGLGLLEGISDADILSKADPNDTDNDGISGRANYVWDVVNRRTALGKFGWKANQPSLLQQVAAAYNGDIGVTSSIFPNETSLGQSQYDGLNDDHELTDSLLHSVEFYVRTLAVPVRRNVNTTIVRSGKQMFLNAGCANCHTPDMRTAVNVSFPQLSNQLIHPFTDMLLHDMGSGLADGRPDFLANGNEWRTAPLWGIGLTQKVNGHNNFLHDGRARNFMEAIMWHGGEAEAAKNKVTNMSAAERNALIKFMESL